jgi:hypothetical protein
MSLNKKFRTCILTFILLISSFSIFVISPENVKAFDGEEFGEEELILLGLHPYVTAGWFIYEGNESIDISGDIIFNLYYFNTFASQFGWKDNLKVTLYTLTPLLSLKEVENGNTTITLEPEKFGDAVQKQAVKLENIDLKIDEGDMLIFAVEIIQTDKPLGNFIGRRLGSKLFDKLRDIGEFLNNSDSDELREIGNTTLQILGLTEEAGITEEEIATLLNSFSSSRFVFNSADYPSSVYLPIDTDENLTLYFHSILDETNGGFGGEGFGSVFMSDVVPNGTSFTWPAHAFTLEGEDNFDNYIAWLTGWLFYITGGLIPDIEERNIINFYLSDNKLVSEKPSSDKPTRLKLKKDTEYKWEGMTFPRNKIIKNVSAELYLYYSKILLFRKITINATLYDITEGKAIGSVVKELDRTKIFELIFRRPNDPTVFEFLDAEEKELWHDHEYELRIIFTGGPLFTLRTTHLLYNSVDYPSSVNFELEETDNIIITNEIEDIDVIPGASAEFKLDIKSVYADTLTIDVKPDDSADLEDFNIEIPGPIDINEGGEKTVKVVATSKNDNVNAYGEDIELTFSVIGDTGFASKKADVEVSEDAAEYFIEVDIPKGKEIKHGESGEYSFRILNKNTGHISDTYDITATSEHDWKLVVLFDDDAVIEVGEELEVKVKVTVPAYTGIKSDDLNLLIKSTRSEDNEKLKTVTVEVTTTVILPNVLENIYHFFETTSESFGLDDVLGDFAAGFLIFIVIFIIVIFLLIIIYLLRIKFVNIICFDRIKEIGPDDKAEFDLEIQNPYRRKLTYELRAEVFSDPESWDILLDTENIEVEPKEKKPIKLSVEPTDYAKQDEWVEIKIIANALEKKKEGSISTITSIKDAKPEISLLGIFHWPKVFKMGQKVVTSFRVENRGKVSTDKISIILYVNGEEKNKVEDITIPRGGYAEIDIPWIAVKGKNKVSIVVK